MANQKAQHARAGISRLFETSMALDYDNLTLVPRIASTLLHRADAQPETRFGPVRMALPLLGSPMPDVCGQEMCQALAREGALGLLHRFQTIEAQVRTFAAAGAETADNEEGTPTAGAAIGVTGDYRERFETLYAAGCRMFCLDTANGAHVQVERTIAWVRGEVPDVFLIAGNVASGEAFSWLEDRGADAIRVGIAGGAVCETRTETGVYVPTPYAVAEAAAVRRRALIIGDSGVRSPSDFCKLLALGADVVMVGSALAGTREAPGSIIMTDGKKYKIMRGAASFSVQQDIGKRDPEYVEGDETLVPYRGNVTTVLRRYLAGLQSSMSYMNARTLEEYRAHVSFLLLR
jgi:IMP dehydrogenase/GMP reductase